MPTTPSVKLLERIIDLRDREIPYIWGTELEEAADRLTFEALEELRRHFEVVSGFGRLSPEYHQAAEIHRQLLEPILREHPEWKSRIRGKCTYYT